MFRENAKAIEDLAKVLTTEVTEKTDENTERKLFLEINKLLCAFIFLSFRILCGLNSFAKGSIKKLDKVNGFLILLITIINIMLLPPMEREARDIFLSYIRKKGLRNTKQREEILDTFLSADKHITVDDLYSHVKKKDPEIGYATVHRNLKLMCESGLADEIKIGNKKAKYEQKYGHEHHDHLICLKCGRFIEVNDERIERLQDKLAEANDFTPQRHKLEIYGLCKKCR